MQKDMHFAGTYIVACAAGFPPAEALTIANCAQYVDDSKITGFLRFDNGALFQRTATCHNLADPDNLNDLDNHLAWLPFHFLPGDQGPSYQDRLVCRKGSQVAAEMVEACLASIPRKPEQKLHRLGITAHVLADTFAHYGFAGIVRDINFVLELDDDEKQSNEDFLTEAQNFAAKVLKFFGKRDTLPMLGHGMVHTCPDLPWLTWHYHDANNQKISRRNPDDFIAGLEALYDLFRRFRLTDGKAAAPAEMAPQLRDALVQRIATIQEPEGETRCQIWQDLIAVGRFPGIPAEKPNYEAEQWRDQALGAGSETFGGERWNDLTPIPLPGNFMSSDWKLFHDAAKDHRYEMTQVILQKRGLCVA